MAMSADHHAVENNSIAKPLTIVFENTCLTMRRGWFELTFAHGTDKCMAKVLLDAACGL
jgi:hypothetical protein